MRAFCPKHRVPVRTECSQSETLVPTVLGYLANGGHNALVCAFNAKEMIVSDFEQKLRALFDRAVEVADPMRSLAHHLPPKPDGRFVVVGAGKASARMAEAVEAAWGPCEGLILTRYGYSRPLQGIRVIEAAHPVPDEAGLSATQELLTLLQGLDRDTFVLCLISGGASALLTAPAEGVTLAEKQAMNGALLASGAPIGRMNIVRKHASRVKGGQLAAACYPAYMVSLMISDVPGDDPAYIGSGPTVGDDSTPQEALDIIADWDIDVPASILSAIKTSSSVVRTDDPRLSHVENKVVAAPTQSLIAAEEIALSWGWKVHILGDSIEGEARDVAAQMAQTAKDIQSQMTPDAEPVLLLSGGELTVTRRGEGVGGPNAEFCLALAVALNGAEGIHALACDTDGVDGAAEVAGAVIGPDTLYKGADAAKALDTNDAHSFFAAIGDQVVTGPTLTNVNDFRAIVITPASA
jgi:hydroxypyruvate reductase